MLHFQSKNYPVSDKIVDYPELGIKITHLHTCNSDIFWMRPDVSSNSIERGLTVEKDKKGIKGKFPDDRIGMAWIKGMGDSYYGGLYYQSYP